jgi:hypothetical protein
MVKDVASKMSDVAGDGTTTATVLAQPIYREGAQAGRRGRKSDSGRVRARRWKRARARGPLGREPVDVGVLECRQPDVVSGPLAPSSSKRANRLPPTWTFERGIDTVNRVLLCRVLGLPVTRVWTFRQSPAAVNALSGTSIAELQVVLLNDSEHVALLLQDIPHRAL